MKTLCLRIVMVCCVLFEGFVALGEEPQQQVAQVPLQGLEDIQNVQKDWVNKSHVTLKFQQTIYRDLRKKSTASKGMVLFQKPDKFRWVKNAPDAEEWIYDGTQLFQFNPETKQALKFSKLTEKSKELNMIVDMILHFESLKKSYQIASATKDQNTVEVLLNPLESSDMTSAKLVFDLKSKAMRSIRLNLIGNNYTQFDFDPPSFQTFSASVFELPKNVKMSSGL